MNPTSISYCDFTLNPGCGCDSALECRARCWARGLHDMRHAAYLAGKKVPPQYAKPFNEIQCFPDRLDEPLRRKKPATIAVWYMGDMFDKGVPFDYLDRVFKTMYCADQHRFLLLTKQLDRAAEYFAETVGWPHIWLGTSAGTQKELDERLPKLLAIPAANVWLSLAPVGEQGDITPFTLGGSSLDWVVIECESGTGRRPCKLEWVKAVIHQCDAGGVPVHIKQLEIDGKVSRKPQEWPEWARRREVP